jgi:hypothetical protein
MEATMTSERTAHQQVHLADLRLKRERLATTTGDERRQLQDEIARLERITRGYWSRGPTEE